MDRVVSGVENTGICHGRRAWAPLVVGKAVEERIQGH